MRISPRKQHVHRSFKRIMLPERRIQRAESVLQDYREDCREGCDPRLFESGSSILPSTGFPWPGNRDKPGAKAL